MRALRFIAIGLAALLIAAVAAVWIVPGLLDWNRYRDTIAAIAGERLGRDVRIDGPVALRLLPEPVLTAARVTIADDGDGVTLSARELRLSVALGPLIAGRVDAQELVLHGPVIHLPWPPRASSFTARPPAWLGALSARVEDGTLIVGALVFTGINAVLQTADTGTLSADGTGARDGLAWHFNARLARPGGDGAAGLDIALDGQGKMAGTGGRFTGQLAAGGEIAGQVVAYGPDLSLLLATPKLPFRAEGRLLASGGLLAEI